MKTLRLKLAGVCLFSVFALSAVSADTLTLGKYVPEHVIFSGGWQHTQERGRIEKAYLEAFEKLIHSGIAADIFELATWELSENERAQAHAMATRVLELLKTPQWKSLFRKEFAFAFNFSASPSAPVPVLQYLALFKASNGEACKRVEEFRKLFHGISQFNPQNLSVQESTRSEAEISALKFKDVPFSLSAAAKDDLVVLSLSDTPFLNKVLDLVDSGDGKGSIIKAKRFRQAFRGLPEPQDGWSYFDLKEYLDFYQAMLGSARHQARGDPYGEGVLDIVETVLSEVSRIHCIASVERTKGNTALVDSRICFLQKNGSGFIEELVQKQDPLSGFLKAVPKDAVCFYATSGLDPAEVYDAIIGLIWQEMPEPGKLLGKWEQMQKHFGFNLRKDLLSWLKGGFGWIMLPPQGSNLCGDCVFFLTIREEEQSRKLIDSCLCKVEKFLESRGQKFTVSKPSESRGNFRELRVGSLPFFRPVIGIPEGYFILASSKGALKRVGAALKGDAPCILERPWFKELEIPSEQLTEVFYHDLEGLLKGLSNIVGAAGFVTSIVPENRETKPVIKLGGILTKLAGFLRDIDLAMDYAAWTHYNREDHSFFSRQATRFKVPEEK